MVNHGRTLLLNVSGRFSPGLDWPGEEYVPADFAALDLPPLLQNIRRLLYGSNPDRHYYNYRLRQFASLLHLSGLEEHTLALDPRITYWPLRQEDLLLQSGGVSTISSPTHHRAFVTGELLSNASLGQMRWEWRVQVRGSALRIRTLTWPGGETSTGFTASQGLTSPAPLPGTGLVIQAEPIDDATFYVEAVACPQRGLAEILADLDRLSGLGELFSTGEPGQTFTNLWHDHPQGPWRLAGLLLALIYRTEEIRLRAT